MKILVRDDRKAVNEVMEEAKKRAREEVKQFNPFASGVFGWLSSLATEVVSNRIQHKVAERKSGKLF